MKKEIKMSNKAFQLIDEFEDRSNSLYYEGDRGVSPTKLDKAEKELNVAYDNLKDYIIKLEQENKKLKKKIKEDAYGKGWIIGGNRK